MLPLCASMGSQHRAHDATGRAPILAQNALGRSSGALFAHHLHALQLRITLSSALAHLTRKQFFGASENSADMPGFHRTQSPLICQKGKLAIPFQALPRGSSNCPCTRLQAQTCAGLCETRPRLFIGHLPAWITPHFGAPPGFIFIYYQRILRLSWSVLLARCALL